jgi:hypothetical protein
MLFSAGWPFHGQVAIFAAGFFFAMAYEEARS